MDVNFYSSLFSALEPHVQFQKEVLGDLCDGSGTSISEHGLRVMLILADTFLKAGTFAEEGRQDILCAAIHHDVLEDTEVTRKELQLLANENVVRLVEELTIDFEDCSIEEAVAPLYNLSPEGVLIKLADIVDNAEKSRFFIYNNQRGFYLGFFLPLLTEYQKIMNHVAQRMSAYEVEFAILFERMGSAVDELTSRLRFFADAGVEL